MAQPNDSVLVTPGSGATIATHLAGAKEHQSFVHVDADGHIIGSRDTYYWTLPVAAVGASKLYGDIFNAAASAFTLKILGVFPILDLDVAAAPVLGIRIDVFRTATLAGTGGTAPTFNGTTTTVSNVTCVNDPTKAALPANVSARYLPTVTPTLHALLATDNIAREETMVATGAAGAAAYLQQSVNLIETATVSDAGEVSLPPGYGLLIKQGPVASLGNIGFAVVFTVA